MEGLPKKLGAGTIANEPLAASRRRQRLARCSWRCHAHIQAIESPEEIPQC